MLRTQKCGAFLELYPDSQIKVWHVVFEKTKGSEIL